MLFSFYPTITQNYFILSFVVCLGTLQWRAAYNRWLTLSLLGTWGLGWAGILTGILLVFGGFIWFFTTTPGLFVPGLAGGELSSLFVLGAICALFITRLSGIFWQAVLVNLVESP